MNIAILGTGSVGSILGRRWSQAGHAVTFGSRQPEREKVLELLERCASGTRAVAPREAIAAAEAVLLAVPWPSARQTLADVGDLGGRVGMVEIGGRCFKGEELAAGRLGTSSPGFEREVRSIPAEPVVGAIAAEELDLFAD